MKLIVACTTQRSGSTMVCEDMMRMGLGKPNEYFMRWMGCSGLDWQEELKTMMQQHSQNGVFAVKVMANQVRRVDMRLAESVAPLDSGPFPHFRAVFRDAAWVYIRREDAIDQAISHFLAKGSGVYHVVKGGEGFMPGAAMHEGSTKQIGEVEYSFKGILEEWHALQAGNLLWQEFFRETNIDPLLIEYGVYDRECLRKIGESLSVEMKEPDGARNLTKMPNTRNLEMKQQFKQDLFARI